MLSGGADSSLLLKMACHFAAVNGTRVTAFMMETELLPLGDVEVARKVALMGCVVNGPGEAREADVGIAGGQGEAVLFRHGEIVDRLPESDIIGRLLREIRSIADSRKPS